jgi:predicted metal-dependent enzyme (double-stranded beta helix superfamily)
MKSMTTVSRRELCVTYEMDDFCRDCRQELAGNSSGLAESLQRVRAHLLRLVSNQAFVDRLCGPDAPPGLHLLFEDGPRGFQVLAHINVQPRVSPPHDHGDSWAVYGQTVGHTDMTVYRRVDDHTDPERATLASTDRYRLGPGDIGVYGPGVIHSIDYPAGSRFIRVTGTNLDLIERRAFDPVTGAIRRALPQQAS